MKVYAILLLQGSYMLGAGIERTLHPIESGLLPAYVFITIGLLLVVLAAIKSSTLKDH